MYRLIKRRYAVIGIGFIIVYIGSLYLKIVAGKLLEESLGKEQGIDFIVHMYVVVCMIIVIYLIREYMLYRKISFQKLEIAYYFSKSKLAIKILVHMLCHAFFWWLILSKNYMYIVLLGPIFTCTIPKIISGCIYLGQGYFIFDGWKFYYNEISGFKEDAFYYIKVYIQGEGQFIRTYNYNRFKVLVNLLEEKVGKFAEG